MTNMKLWLRWSWRDLRSRWVQVLAIAVIIALGTAVFAGMGGQKTWRIKSYDESYARLNMFDLRVELASGGYVDQNDLIETLRGIDGVADVNTRLISPTLVDASHEGDLILVRGRLIGMDVSAENPINGVYVDSEHGRTLTAADSGQNVAVVEYKFAKHYGLEPGHPIRVSGDISLEMIGAGHSPEYFLVMPGTGEYFAEANFAAVFVPLDTAQQLTGRQGLVNDALLKLKQGADPAAVTEAIKARLAEALPNTGVTVTTKADEPVHQLLYEDAKGDQQTWDSLATLFLIGAALGAFNLAGRMVEAQRREIGVGMALGVPRRWIAFRPMLVGLQIAVLGTVLGIVIGLGLSQAFAGILKSIAPLPFYDFDFYAPGYIRAILLGITIPFAATLLPVWRAVRVPPVDAIQTGYMVAKGGGLSWIANHLPLPGRSFTHMPIKNVLRSPWRTTLTVLGIAIAVLLMVVVMGTLDTYVHAMDQADEAFRHTGRDRVLVNLNFFYPVSNGEISALRSLTKPDGSPLFAQTETALQLGGTLKHSGTEIETSLELHDMQNAIWTPRLVKGQLTNGQPGLIISQKAAEDLGVDVGDTVLFEHPQRTGLITFKWVESELPVVGIHDNPLRPLSYMDLNAAALMGLDNATNRLVLSPAPGVGEDDIKLAMLTQQGVSSVEPISDFSKAVEGMLELITEMLFILSGVVLVLSFLIAFNTTSISVDERVREIATMFAFGLRIRTVTRMQMLENFIIGAMGTIIGFIGGWAVIEYLFTHIDSRELDELRFVIKLGPQTVLLAILVGVVVVALTPVLSVRRMRRMNISSTLRVME